MVVVVEHTTNHSTLHQKVVNIIVILSWLKSNIEHILFGSHVEQPDNSVLSSLDSTTHCFCFLFTAPCNWKPRQTQTVPLFKTQPWVIHYLNAPITLVEEGGGGEWGNIANALPTSFRMQLTAQVFTAQSVRFVGKDSFYADSGVARQGKAKEET